MEKIACIGTHSVGKSTFCYKLAQEYKKKGHSVHIVQERVRFSPFPINESMKLETCIWACTNQISKELEAEQRGFTAIICDRSPFDTFIYAERLELIGLQQQTLRLYALQWLSSYDKIYFVRPNEDDQPMPDCIRALDLDFLYEIDRRFEYVLRQNQIETEIIYTKDIFK